MTPQLAITMGDPAGVGPEIIIKACKQLEGRIRAGELRLLVIGSNASLEPARKTLDVDFRIEATSETAET